MKSMLPRRESERKSHALARHCDILSAVETRISMLSMTYMRYIETGLCCFIPGKVIDEINRILVQVENSMAPLRTHDLLQELRDISSMAMEHFDENILPHLREEMDISTFSFVPPSTSSSSKSSPKVILVQHSMADELNKVRKQTKSTKQQMVAVADLIKKMNVKIKRQAKLLQTKSKLIHAQEQQLQQQSVKIGEQETSIADLKKHMDEWDQKFSDLSAELVRAREELSKKVLPAAAAAATKEQTTSTTTAERGRADVHVFGRLWDYGLKKFDLDLKKRKSTLSSEIPCKMSRKFGPAGALEHHHHHRPSTDRVTQTCSGEDICNKIQDNITSNISKMITRTYGAEKETGLKGIRKRFAPFLSESIEAIIKSPITSIKSRKRKSTEPMEI